MQPMDKLPNVRSMRIVRDNMLYSKKYRTLILRFSYDVIFICVFTSLLMVQVTR